MSALTDELLRERMAAAVTRALHIHPRMEPLLQGSLLVEHGPTYLQAMVVIDGCGHALRLRDPDWWILGQQTVEDRAQELANRLAMGLRVRWDNQSEP